MSSIQLFLRGCLLQYRALFNWATVWGYFTHKVLLAVSQMAFFVQVGTFATGSGSALYYAVGNALQLTAINGVFGVVMTVGNERLFGTLPLLLGSPANRLATFLGRAFMHVLDGMTSVVFGFAVAVIVYRLDLGRADLPLLAGCILLISLSTAGLGLMLGSLSLITRDLFALSNSVYYLLLVVCGVNVPLERLPAAARVLAGALPLTRGVEAARRALRGADPGAVSQLLAGEVAVGAVYVALGYGLFRWLEHRARSGGLQEAI